MVEQLSLPVIQIGPGAKHACESALLLLLGVEIRAKSPSAGAFAYSTKSFIRFSSCCAGAGV